MGQKAKIVVFANNSVQNCRGETVKMDWQFRRSEGSADNEIAYNSLEMQLGLLIL